MNHLVISRILNSEQLDFMKFKLELILAEKGDRLDHPEVLRIVKDAGAKVLESRVYFPRQLIEEALNKVPYTFTLAFDEIIGLTGRDAFISLDHTLRHFREIARPETFFRDTRHAWEKDGSKSLLERSRDIYASIRKNYQDFSLSEDISREIEGIIIQADKELSRSKGSRF